MTATAAKYLQQMIALNILDAFHRAGAWTPEHQDQAMSLIRGGLGTPAAAWTRELLRGQPQPLSEQWPRLHRDLLTSYAEALRLMRRYTPNSR